MKRQLRAKTNPKASQKDPRGYLSVQISSIVVQLLINIVHKHNMVVYIRIIIVHIQTIVVH